MSAGYKLYHPKWHRRRMPIFWWLGKLAYTRFIARELTSLGVAYAALLLVVQVWALGRGEEAYGRLQEALASVPAVLVHTLLLAALLFHSFTWLSLAPRALVVRLGRRRLPDALVLAAHYLAWIAASAAVVWLLLSAGGGGAG